MQTIQGKHTHASPVLRIFSLLLTALTHKDWLQLKSKSHKLTAGTLCPVPGHTPGEFSPEILTTTKIRHKTSQLIQKFGSFLSLLGSLTYINKVRCTLQTIPKRLYFLSFFQFSHHITSYHLITVFKSLSIPQMLQEKIKNHSNLQVWE